MDSTHLASDPGGSAEPEVPSTAPTADEASNRTDNGNGEGGSGSATGTGGPQQSRARVTVVCQECKRLKLKCDRKAPCSQCVKRGTLERCMYSQAATEKVDMHSMNNRVQELEIALGAFARGVPVDFNPQYPPAVDAIKKRIAAYDASGAQASSSGHHNHEGVAVEGNLSLLSGINVSVNDYAHVLTDPERTPLDGEMCLCCDPLNLSGGLEVPFEVKKEPVWEQEDDSDSIMHSTGSLTPIAGSSKGKSKAKSTSLASAGYSHPRISSRQNVQPYLPPLSIYYEEPPIPIPGSSTASSGVFSPVPHVAPHARSADMDAAPLFYPQRPISAQGPAIISGTPLSATLMGPPPPPSRNLPPPSLTPRITPALIDVLPPPATCIQFLHISKDVLSPFPVELGFPAGTAAWPTHLKVRAKNLPPSPVLGWKALFKRSRRVFVRAGMSVGHAGKVKSKVVSTSESGKARTKEKPGSSIRQQPSQNPEVERMKAIYFGVSRANASPPEQQTGEVSDAVRPPQISAGSRVRSPIPFSESSPSSLASSQDLISSTSSGQSRRKDSSVPAPPSTESLPFFALLCALMAVGAANEPHTALRAEVSSSSMSSPSGASASPAFLYALSQQALTAWTDAGESSPTSGQFIEEEAREMRADYLRACVVGLRYLLGDNGVSHSCSKKKCQSLGNAHRHAVLSLLGKMANALRIWGYTAGLFSATELEPPQLASVNASRKAGSSKDRQARDRSNAEKESDDLVEARYTSQLIEYIRFREGEEARKRVFWEVLYYDLFLADRFGEQPLIPATWYSSSLPAITPEPQSLDHDESAIDVDDFSISRKEKGKDDDERLRVERMYFVLRARITQVMFLVKKNLSSPDCSCGYTLDQAAKLEGSLTACSTEFSPEFRWGITHGVIGSSSELVSLGDAVARGSGAGDDRGIRLQGSTKASKKSSSGKDKGKGKPREGDGSHEKYKSSKSAPGSIDVDQGSSSLVVEASREGPSQKTSTHILSCELALTMQVLLLNIYSPFISSATSTVSQSTATVARQRVISSMQAIIRISKLLHGLLGMPSTPPSSSSPTPMPTPLLSMCSLENFVFDASVMCARIAFGVGLDESATDPVGMTRGDPGSTEMMQSIKIALDLLETIHRASRSSGLLPLIPGLHSVKVRLVQSYRNQLLAKLSTFSSHERRKRTRSIMEGNSTSGGPSQAGAIEDNDHADADGSIPEPLEGNALETNENVNLPPSLHSAIPFPRQTQSPALVSEIDRERDAFIKSVPRNRTSNAAKVNLGVKVSEKKTEKKRRQKSIPSRSSGELPSFSIRARTTKVSEGKRKKELTPVQQPLLTTAPRAIKDGRMEYLEPSSQPQPQIQDAPPPGAPPNTAQGYPDSSKPQYAGMGDSVPLLSTELSHIPHSGYNTHPHTPNTGRFSAPYDANDPTMSLDSLPPLGARNPPLYEEDYANYGAYPGAHNRGTPYVQTYGALTQPPTPTASTLPSDDYFAHQAGQPTASSPYPEQIYGTRMGTDEHQKQRQGMHNPAFEIPLSPHHEVGYSSTAPNPADPSSNWAEDPASAQARVHHQVFEWQGHNAGY